MKTKREINEMKHRKIIDKANKTKNLFFGKINKIEQPLSMLTKTKR